jgi:hypothetical protein
MASRIAIAFASAAVFWAGSASANTNINLDGIAFHPSSNASTTCASYGTTDVTNSCSSANTFSAALPFVPTGTSNLTIYVDGYNPSGGMVTCYAYSYNYDGTFLGNSSFNYSSTGTFDQPLTLTSAALSSWAYLSVICTLPQGGVLYGAAGHF